MGEAKIKKRALAFIAEIDEAELAVRLMEVAIGYHRPPGETMTPREILARAMAQMGPDEAFQFDKMARRAIEYFAERIKEGSVPS